MNETLKKLSTEIAKEIADIVKATPMQDFIMKTKDASVDECGTFDVIISTADVDRQGESVLQNGWDLSHFKANPVVLFGHDYYSLPIGICDSVEIVEGKLVAKGRFAPADANPFAQQVRKLYDLKIMRATSVGFIVKEAQGHEITKAELIEFSFVPVPANPYALSMRQVESNALDMGMLTAKGIKLEVKAEDAPEVPEKPAETPSEETPTQETPVEPEVPAEVALEPETPQPEAEKPVEEAEKAVAPMSRKSVEEVGATLSAMQSTIDNAIVEASKKIMEILGKPTDTEEEVEEEKNVSVGSEDAGGDAGEEGQETDTPSQRSSEEDVASEALKTWLEQRAILRAIATATTNALTSMNDRIRKERGF